MNNMYVKGWGIPIGTFDENDLKNKKDKLALEKYQKEYPQYKYTNTKIIKENNTRKIAIFICNVNDMKITF